MFVCYLIDSEISDLVFFPFRYINFHHSCDFITVHRWRWENCSKPAIASNASATWHNRQTTLLKQLFPRNQFSAWRKKSIRHLQIFISTSQSVAVKAINWNLIKTSVEFDETRSTYAIFRISFKRYSIGVELCFPRAFFTFHSFTLLFIKVCVRRWW